MEEISKKIVLVGHFGVGKTSLIRRFVHSKFSEEYISTIGVKVDKKTIQVGEVQMNMLIWDVAGESSLTKIPVAYLNGSHGFFYVFDLTRPSTYEALESETQMLREKFPAAALQILGNKVDLLSPEAKLAFETQMAGKYHHLSSALTGEFVEDAFGELGKEMLAK